MDHIFWHVGLLILIILWLLINRHIIGGIWYNFFPPIIVGYAMYVLSPSYNRTLLIILSTIWWRITTKMITNYINLSLYPRYVLYTIISITFFTSGWFWYISQYNLGQLSTISSQYMIFLFLIIVSMGTKVYSWGRWFISLMRWLHITRFFMISILISYLLSIQDIQIYFSDHIISIIILVICTIFVWSYTWLQLKEIIRFRKLIRTKITGKRKRS